MSQTVNSLLLTMLLSFLLVLQTTAWQRIPPEHSCYLSSLICLPFSFFSNTVSSAFLNIYWLSLVLIITISLLLITSPKYGIWMLHGCINTICGSKRKSMQKYVLIFTSVEYLVKILWVKAVNIFWSSKKKVFQTYWEYY